ncbi:hypothetical protein GGU11DRAFT_757641 [Lentinula aff. detonsa]|nr:hypothetical protein GGU11DRAFT_757641 [Lentinula aff. detonsa]
MLSGNIRWAERVDQTNPNFFPESTRPQTPHDVVIREYQRTLNTEQENLPLTVAHKMEDEERVRTSENASEAWMSQTIGDVTEVFDIRSNERNMSGLFICKPTGALFLRSEDVQLNYCIECFYSKDGVWYYAGVYKAFRLEHPLSNETTQAIVKETIEGRKNASPQNTYEVNELYAAGALKVAVIALQKTKPPLSSQAIVKNSFDGSSESKNGSVSNNLAQDIVWGWDWDWALGISGTRIWASDWLHCAKSVFYFNQMDGLYRPVFVSVHLGCRYLTLDPESLIKYAKLPVMRHLQSPWIMLQ